MDQKAIQVIEALGGAAAVAVICEITPQAVSQWKTDGIPQARQQYLELKYPQAFAVSEQTN